MQGPSAPTTSVAPRPRMAPTAASTTPSIRPRHPAWTAPNTPSRLPRAIEAQSAVRTATATEGAADTRASPWPVKTAAILPERARSGGLLLGPPVATTTDVPWTWSAHRTSSTRIRPSVEPATRDAHCSSLPP